MLSNKTFIIGFLITSATFFSFCTLKHYPLNSVRKVVIDAGHGGKDPGTGNGKEKRYALDIALKLGEKIKNNLKDVEVIYTRDSDVFIPLNERAEIANKNKADLFISIHCNAFTSANASGTETYVMGLHKSEANLNLAKRENNVILMEDNYKKSYKGFNPNSPLAHIMLANYQSAFMNQSMDFASRVERQFIHHGNKSRGVKQAGFLVIWETTMPSVLIETGYLSNPTDARKLASESGRDNIAKAIYTAFNSYKSDVERNQ
ncbi:N-acetylmuramoyl-L-alanine amidase family protein [Arcticibacterium luteifluviistationis]|uniref:N-acetylmuramoyl-L-alanine amidase n=1 Tax=Arcticibacterium luteifluviistationis TaxID=1784714 RepID=A0A2Z4GDY1_9BACT|nr:N-acetylmuramoyl-L-alanine amidase [Arcticibacterium luteifluviistationis]AWV99235.1 N-acetylmuramoyl-L-alanine amidase [Arcticibacterium luteifluviistationis]